MKRTAAPRTRRLARTRGADLLLTVTCCTTAFVTYQAATHLGASMALAVAAGLAAFGTARRTLAELNTRARRTRRRS